MARRTPASRPSAAAPDAPRSPCRWCRQAARRSYASSNSRRPRSSRSRRRWMGTHFWTTSTQHTAAAFLRALRALLRVPQLFSVPPALLRVSSSSPCPPALLRVSSSSPCLQLFSVSPTLLVPFMKYIAARCRFGADDMSPLSCSPSLAHHGPRRSLPRRQPQPARRCCPGRIFCSPLRGSSRPIADSSGKAAWAWISTSSTTAPGA